MKLINADALMETLERGDWVHITDYNIAIYAVKDAPTVDAVPLGVEMWEDRFNIQTRTWRTKDGETEATSFIITRREQKDGDHDRG